MTEHWHWDPAGVPAALSHCQWFSTRRNSLKHHHHLTTPGRAVPYLSPRSQPGQGHPSSVTREETDRPQRDDAEARVTETRRQHQEGNLRLQATNPVSSGPPLSSHRRNHPRGSLPHTRHCPKSLIHINIKNPRLSSFYR